MNRWDEPNNIFAPLLAGVPSDAVWAGFGNALIAASESLPVVEIAYSGKRPNSFRGFREVRHRLTVTIVGDNAKPFSARVDCVDKPIEKPCEGLAYWSWSLAMTRLKQGTCTPGIPEDFDPAILECRMMRLTEAGQESASQLALVRHLWASAVLAASPRSIVFGGQQTWKNEWWPEVANGVPE
jgi:hypothetical protein